MIALDHRDVASPERLRRPCGEIVGRVQYAVPRPAEHQHRATEPLPLRRAVASAEMKIRAQRRQQQLQEIPILQQFKRRATERAQLLAHVLVVAGEPFQLELAPGRSLATGNTEPNRTPTVAGTDCMGELERDECAHAVPEDRKRFGHMGLRIGYDNVSQSTPVVEGWL